MNGKTANAVNSVSGSVSNNNLRINVNGVSSGDIPLPESIKEYDISGDMEDFVTYNNPTYSADPYTQIGSYSTNTQYTSTFNGYILKAGDNNIEISNHDYLRAGPTVYRISGDITQSIKTLIENKVKEMYNIFELQGTYMFRVFFYRDNNSSGNIDSDRDTHYCTYDGSTYSVYSSSNIYCRPNTTCNKFMVIVGGQIW